jgi:hypothetical protein
MIAPKLPDRGTPSRTEDTDQAIPKRIKKIPEMRPVHPFQFTLNLSFTTYNIQALNPESTPTMSHINPIIIYLFGRIIKFIFTISYCKISIFYLVI